jgi:PAS domain S-box-containing protein
MKSSSVWNRKAQLGFGVAILTLLGAGVISYRALVVSNQSERWVRHTDQVLEELQGLLSASQNIESSSRGFALTGDKSYIESFKGNTLREARAEGSIEQLTADNPVQLRRLPVLKNLLAQKIRFCESVIDLRRGKGMEAAAALVGGDLGQHITGEIQDLVLGMQEEERRLLKIRNAGATRQLDNTKIVLALGSLVGLLTALGAEWSVRRENVKRGRAELTLRDMEGKYRGLLEAAPDAMVVVNQSGEIVLLNVQAEKQFGYRRDELVGQKVKNIIPEGFAERLIADGTRSTAEALAQQIGTGIELSGRRKDGSEFPIEIMLSPLESTEGILVTAAIRDVTARRTAEKALREAEESFRALANNISQLAWMADEKGSIFWYNQRWFDYTGTTLKEMAGWGWQVVHHPDHVQQVVTKLSKCFETGDIWEDTFPLRGRDSNYRWFLSRAVPIRNSEGKVSRWFGTNTDITERKKSEEQLVKMVGELKRSNEELQQFAYVASHDLQEPLRMVASYTELLASRYKGKLDADADEFIGFAVDGCNRMQRLIQDLLAYSRSGSDGKELQKRSSENALNNALKNLSGALEESGAVVTRDALPEITTDDKQLTQVFQNLVGNAIKYRGTEVPAVHISATRKGLEHWTFSVRDNGLGIEAQYFERIFIIFQRLHGRTEFKGTGIGLSICKKIVEGLGGRIWVESQLGKGSTFYFALPERG